MMHVGMYTHTRSNVLDVTIANYLSVRFRFRKTAPGLNVLIKSYFKQLFCIKVSPHTKFSIVAEFPVGEKQCESDGMSSYSSPYGKVL